MLYHCFTKSASEELIFWGFFYNVIHDKDLHNS